MIDTKIKAQSVLIMGNFSVTFFDIRSTFKGRFRSISYNYSWLNCFNGCGIESKKQENHEELKIFLQNCLISSRFNQKFGLQRKNMGFNRKFHRKNRGPSDSLKDDSTAEIGGFKWAIVPRSPHDSPPPFLKEFNPENPENAWKIKMKSRKFYKIQKFVSFFI